MCIRPVRRTVAGDSPPMESLQQWYFQGPIFAHVQLLQSWVSWSRSPEGNVQGLVFVSKKLGIWWYESSPTDTWKSCFSDVKQLPQAMGPLPNPATSDTRWDVRSLGWFVFFVAGRFGKILRQCSQQNTIKPCTRTQRTNQLSPMGRWWLWNEPL